MKQTGYSLKLMDVICVTNRLLQLPLQQQHASYKNDHFSFPLLSFTSNLLLPSHTPDGI